ncbi:hypothetical protein MRX96_045744 [Rhipicephalus microplus]
MAWSQLLKYRDTSWHFFSDGLSSFLRANAREGRQTLAIVPSLKIEPTHFLKLLNYSFAYHVTVYWVLVQDDAVINDEMTLYAKISPSAKVSILGHCKRGVVMALIFSDQSRSPVLFSGKADLLLSPTNLDDIIVDAFSFADTNLHHDTFYALANDTRSVLVFSVLSYSA